MSVRWRGFSVIPWRRSTARACASVVRHSIAVVRVDGLVAREADERPRAEVLERCCPAWEAALQLARRVGASRLTDESVAFCALRCRDVRSRRAGAAPARSVWTRPPARRRRRRRDRSYRLLSRGCARRPNKDAVVANGLGYGRLARRGFRGRVRALPGWCARRRSARRGRTSARARAGSDRRSRGLSLWRPRRSRSGCPQRAGADGSMGARSGRALSCS